jgi:DNA-binding transcriptional LysR family regulator
VPRYCLLAALALWLVACSGSETIPTPTAIPPVRVVTTASAQPFVQAATDRAFTGPAPFIINLAALPDLINTAKGEPVVGITLYLPEGTGLWATPLGNEPIAIIVNQASPAQALTLKQLADIYTGHDPAWVAAAREDGDDSRLFFESVALQGLRPAATTRLTTTPEAMRQFVSTTPNGLGYLPLRWVDATLRIVPIEGKLPSEAGYPLTALVVAVAQTEPSGPARTWLGNLQKGSVP